MRKPSTRGASGSCTTTAKTGALGHPGSFEKKCEVVAVVGVHFWNRTEMVEIGKAHSQLANIQLLCHAASIPSSRHSPRLDSIELHSILRSPS